jgi:hypothetical protein
MQQTRYKIKEMKDNKKGKYKIFLKKRIKISINIIINSHFQLAHHSPAVLQN